MVHGVPSRGVRVFSMIAANSVYWIYLTSKTRHGTSRAFAIERSRGACVRKRLSLILPRYSVTGSGCSRKGSSWRAS